MFQALMEMDCIPAGMELFPAADEEQWAFIRRVIDDCDYYLLIIGGRYGSVTPEGVSYTEKEFDYACEKGIRVIAFLHQKPDDLTVAKSDIDPTARKRLQEFRDKVATGRLVKFWNNANELPGLVALSLSKTIKAYPARGWVRTPSSSNEEMLSELNELRKRLAESENEVRGLRATQEASAERATLASLDTKLTVRGSKTNRNGVRPWERTTSWGELFASIAPELLQFQNDAGMNLTIARLLGPGGRIDEDVFQTIKIQLSALGLVTIDYLKTTKGGMALFWSLTDLGQQELYSRRTIKAE